MMTTEEKRYDPGDSALKFVSRPDDITLDDDPDTLRAEMSCGHAVTPESLTGWCRSLLDQGQYKFLCPALKDGTRRQCGEEWPYVEVRRLALLTQEEQWHFEEMMAVLAAAEFCQHKACPGCASHVERADLTNLCVLCTICTVEKRRSFHFCWQCLQEWTGPAPRPDRCQHARCVNPDLQKLAGCRSAKVAGVEGVPTLRACPTCGNVVEHDLTGCKNITCNRCRVEFCFVCLKVTSVCSSTAGYFRLCSDGIAPRQTSLPTWRRR